MLLSIDPHGPGPIHQQVKDSIVPIYQQIRNRIVEAIAAGELPTGSGLPATRQLAVDLGINFHTVNKAYGLLRREWLLRIGRKAGAVVQRDAAGGPPEPGWEQDWAGRLRTLLAEAAAQGLSADGINPALPGCRSPVRIPSRAGRGRQRGENPVMTPATLTGYIAVPLSGALMCAAPEITRPALQSGSGSQARPVSSRLAAWHVRQPSPLGIVALMSFNVITPTPGLALGLAAALLVVDVLGWRAAAAMFDR